MKGSRFGTITSGRCPNDPADVKCCWANSCAYIAHGRCPGGPKVKCWPRVGLCFHVSNNKCPGGRNYKYIGDAYKTSSGNFVEC